jgi:hypothetical protein
VLSRTNHRQKTTSNHTSRADGSRRSPQTRKNAAGYLGVSVQGTLAGARSLQRTYPAMGAYIAELTIPDDAPLSFDPEGTGPGHYDIYDREGNETIPTEILRYVTMTVPARPSRPRRS